VAWLAVIPTALVGTLTIWLLGPAVGRALFAPEVVHFWSVFQPEVRPEPTEQGRFLLALMVPLLLAASMLGGRRWRPPATAAAAALCVQLAGLAFVVLCIVKQRQLYTTYPPGIWPRSEMDVFSSTTLLVAGAATLALLPVTRSPRLSPLLTRWTRETRTAAVIATLAAAGAIVVWLLHAFYTEGTAGAAPVEVRYHIPFILDETFAVLNGRSPLVDYSAQYASLWPYAFAGAMSLLGTSLGTWITLVLCATAVGMLAIFAVLRRVARSSIVGLLLFLPVLASSFFIIEGTLETRFTFANYYGMFPMRTAGPSILAWLTARHLSGTGTRRIWWLFATAGIVVLNNVEFGLPALGATVASMLWGRGLARARVRQLLLEAAAGLAVAFAVVSVVTLAHAGELPRLALLVRFARLFAAAGFAMFPMPTLGLHVVIYLTYVAAIGVATAQALRPSPDRLLAGMLAWSGVFGLGAGAYYVGRSTPDNLIPMFFPWSFALALLIIPTMRSLPAASWRRPPVAAAACVFAFLVLTCSLAQTPTPWGQLHRLRHTGPAVFAQPAGQRFIAQHTHAGEHVVILLMLGHKIATTLGITNVSPYSNNRSLFTTRQLDGTLALLRAAHGRKVFLDVRGTSGDLVQALEDDGYALISDEPQRAAGLWMKP
jgi:hypothetical protein